MGKFQLNLTNFQRGDFYSIRRKIILNEVINNKDFSMFELNYVKFFNCSFKNVSFDTSTGYSLSFYNCQFDYVSFSKTDLIKINFQNCQLVNCAFSSADLYIINYLNCQLEKVKFNAANLMDFKVENSQLLDVTFGGSEIEDLRITNSILKNIGCEYITVTNSNLGLEKKIQIENYSSFLKEFVKTQTDYDKIIQRSYFICLFSSFGLLISLIAF